jgi:hypothetical protein
MIERKRFAVDDEYSISVVTEQMKDGTWAVVASIVQQTPTGEKTTDLPVSDERFGSEAAAEEAGVRQAREWLDRNMPRAA